VTERLTRALAAVLVAASVVVLPATPARADRVRDNQWHLRALNVAAAHRISQGAGVTVAVIDSGVDPHPDLRNNLLTGTDIVSGGTGDGRSDADGHGTEVAGLIAAHGRGTRGILGIAPKANILPIRDQTPTVAGRNRELAKGIAFAVGAGADVVNISGGGSPDPELQRAVQEAIAAGVVVVAAVGNRPNELVVSFPAQYDGVIAVGATDKNGNRAEISVTGDKLTLLAPGIDIHSTYPKGRYVRSDGTSNATAIVAGAAALVRSKYPDLSAQEVVHRLTATATDKGAPGRDPEYGYGVLNLVAALTADVPALQPTAAGSASPTAGSPPTAAAQPLPRSGSRAAVYLLVAVGLLLLLAAAGYLLFRARRGPRAPDRARPDPRTPDRGIPPAQPAPPPGAGSSDPPAGQGNVTGGS
jgi:type VII secretion-associated serine protease mycosin